MSLKFGTDGVRGVANVDLTPERVLALGRAVARVLGPSTYVVARDTRVSGPLLLAALTAGLAAEGADVVDLGVLPSPGVAWISVARDVPGVMISASHNPYQDNGIKVFAAGGRKLPDEFEAAIEREIMVVGPAGRSVGRVQQDPDAAAWYERQLVATLDGRRLDGLRVVLDCAAGATSGVAPAVFRVAGADVDVIHDDPGDGTRINDGCGSTHPESLQQTVVERGADVGLAFDGDGDRVLAVDHTGALVDGDGIIAMCASDLHARGLLKSDTVVVTVMTNLGFHLAMRERGIKVEQTAVGDRYVLEALETGGWSLGGEQSGHVIFRDLATTGDGILTGLQLLDLLQRSGRSLADLAAASMTRLPQVLHNVRVTSPGSLKDAGAVWDEVGAVESELGENGRVLLRPSGTEPLVRVMVEATTEAQAEAAAQRLVAAVKRALVD